MSEQTKNMDSSQINSEELVQKISQRNPVKKHNFQNQSGDSYFVSDFNQIVSFDKKFDHQKVSFKNPVFE